MIEIYTDGSAHPNPGPGGYGVIVLDKDKNKCYNNYSLVEVYSKQYNKTTNNECELKAILYSFLKYGVKENSCEIPILYSDSAYAINTFTNWMFCWAKKGWLKSNNQPPENLDIIQAFYNWYQKGYRIELRKVPGHSGNYWNEMADKLATGSWTPEEVKQGYRLKDKLKSI